MYNTIDVFMKKMQEFFPITTEAYKKSVISHGKILETVIIEDIFLPEIINLLKANRNIEVLESLFNYFEEIVSGNNIQLINTLSVTILESIGNEKEILNIARSYMGEKTKMLQKEADKAIGRR